MIGRFPASQYLSFRTFGRGKKVGDGTEGVAVLCLMPRVDCDLVYACTGDVALRILLLSARKRMSLIDVLFQVRTMAGSGATAVAPLSGN
jgi:hypothetical protein